MQRRDNFVYRRKIRLHSKLKVKLVSSLLTFCLVALSAPVAIPEVHASNVFPPEIWVVGAVYPNMPNYTHWICAVVRASEPTVEVQVWIWNPKGVRVVDGEFMPIKFRYSAPWRDWHFFLFKWTPEEAGNYTMVLFAYYRNSQNYPPTPDIKGPFIFTIQNNTEVPSTRRFSIFQVRS